MQPLLLLEQTLEAPYDPGPLKIDGPNVRFTSFQQLFSHDEVSLKLENRYLSAAESRMWERSHGS